MKRLNLTETPAAEKKYRGEMIYESAKKQLTAFAEYEARLLYKTLYGKTPNYEKDEELCIPTSELKRLLVKDTCYEKKVIDYIVIELDGTIVARTKEGEEWDSCYDMSFEEIVNIVDALEEAYLAKVGKA